MRKFVQLGASGMAIRLFASLNRPEKNLQVDSCLNYLRKAEGSKCWWSSLDGDQGRFGRQWLKQEAFSYMGFDRIRNCADYRYLSESKIRKFDGCYGFSEGICFPNLEHRLGNCQ